MNEALTYIWSVTILIAILGAIPYLIWMYRTARKRLWRKLGLLVTFPALYFGALSSVSYIADDYAYARELEMTFNTKVKLGKPIYSYESPRSFNGDGYSIWVYNLPESVKLRFESFDKSLAADYPHKPDYRSHWKTVAWQMTPLSSEHNDYLDFALSSYDLHNNPELKSIYDDIRVLMKTPGTFYAYHYYDPGDYPGNIDMFIVDYLNNRLIVINHNT
jgi:hypothetical protein